MIAFKHSALINAPLQKVFSVVADPKKIPQWRSDVPSVSRVSGETKVGGDIRRRGAHYGDEAIADEGN